MSDTVQVLEVRQSKINLPLGLIVFFALLIRLMFVLVIDPVARVNTGGDTGWLLAAGQNLFNGTLPAGVPAGPIYLVFAGLMQQVFGSAAPQLIRILNTVIGAAVCGFVGVIGSRFFNRRIGLLAAIIIAVNPIFIIESGIILTESVFIFFLFVALALYASTMDHLQWKQAATIGIVLGIASLTRAAALAFPALLMVHLIYRFGRPAFRIAGILLLAYILTLSSWTIFNLIKWNHFVIGADGLIANVYLGTTSQGWCGASCVDQGVNLSGQSDAQAQFLNKALSNIGTSVGHYLSLRLSNLSSALLQPHNTEYYPGVSIKDAVSSWWATGHSLTQLASLTSLDNFWPKLLLYVFHYGALLLGLLGMLLSIHQFKLRLPVYGIIGYFLALHLILTAIPRYLFPAELGWILFAAFALDAVISVFLPEMRGSTVAVCNAA